MNYITVFTFTILILQLLAFWESRKNSKIINKQISYLKEQNKFYYATITQLKLQLFHNNIVPYSEYEEYYNEKLKDK